MILNVAQKLFSDLKMTAFLWVGTIAALVRGAVKMVNTKNNKNLIGTGLEGTGYWVF